MLDALVGGKQSEGEGDDLALQAELVFVKVGVHEGDVGDAVRDEVNFFFGDAVEVAKEGDGAAAHDDEAIGELGQLEEDLALVGVGLFEDGVEGGDDGHAEFAQESEDMAAGGAAEDAVFMLETDQIHVVDVEEVGGALVGGEFVLLEFEANAGRVGVALRGVVDGDGEAGEVGESGGEGFAEIGGEGGDAAAAGQVVADYGDATERVLPSASHEWRLQTIVAGRRGRGV